ncbi:MAG: bacteriohemerythrin [Candidatus Margulisiibacteriota bacterium]
MEKLWSPEYEVGNESIDNHHRELFTLTKMLDEAFGEDPRTEIEKIVVFLEAYVIEHFQEEENLMRKHKYNGLDHHRVEHEIFRSRVTLLRKYFNDKIPNTKLMFYIRQCIDKLVDHVLTVDIGIASIAKHSHRHR